MLEPVNLICGWNSPNQFRLLSLWEIGGTQNWWWCVKNIPVNCWAENSHSRSPCPSGPTGFSWISCQWFRWNWSGGSAFLFILMTFSSASFSEQLVWKPQSSTTCFIRAMSFQAMVYSLRGLFGQAWSCLRRHSGFLYLQSVSHQPCSHTRWQMTFCLADGDPGQTPCLIWWLRTGSLSDPAQGQ